MTTDLASLPFLGAGLGLRSEFAHLVLLHQDRIDFLELIGEHFLEPNRETAQQLSVLAEHFPLVVHTISLSLGSTDGPDRRHLEALARLVQNAHAPWFGDHLCYTRAGGVDIGHLAPLPRTEEALAAIRRNVALVRDQVDAPIVLENIAYVADPPGSTMSEAEFVSRAVVETDSGMLLDLTNLHANSVNHDYDPYEWLNAMPLDRVVQIHITGGHYRDGVLIDSHSSRTPDDVWSLLAYTAERAPIKAVLLERDEHIPAIEDLLAELDVARSILAGSEVARGA